MKKDKNKSKITQVVEEFPSFFSRIHDCQGGNDNYYYKVEGNDTAILTTSKKMGLETQGIYNPFVLPLLQQSGYRGAWPKTETVTTKLDFSDRAFHHIDQLQINGSTIQIPADSAIDLGGIGKGYLLDQIAKQAESSGFSDFWFSLGGDIIFIGYDENQKSWSIGIADATDEDRDIDKLETEGEKIAVATSGIIKRKGNDWHHLIDPRTGQPAETDILSATVIAISGVEADVFAKCLVIQGEKLAEKFIREHKILKAYIQTKNQHKPIILTGNNHG